MRRRREINRGCIFFFSFFLAGGLWTYSGEGMVMVMMRRSM